MRGVFIVDGISNLIDSRAQWDVIHLYHTKSQQKTNQKVGISYKGENEFVLWMGYKILFLYQKDVCNW